MGAGLLRPCLFFPSEWTRQTKHCQTNGERMSRGHADGRGTAFYWCWFNWQLSAMDANKSVDTALMLNALFYSSLALSNTVLDIMQFFRSLFSNDDELSKLK